VIAISLAEVAELTGGRLSGISAADAAVLVVDGPVITDSRQAGPGSLYVARIGESLDGHDFVAGAGAAGAVAALTTREVDDLPCVVVADVQDAFAALSRRTVDRAVGLTVIGITGSSGKTSTKDLLGSVLGEYGETVAPEGSYNSEVGVPLTVTRITTTTRFLVVEMGARGIGHIRYLATMAPPWIGVVLNVGTAHLGEFGSRRAIAAAKAELVEALPADGVAVLNADDPAVRAMSAATTARVVLVGEAPDADVRAEDVALDADGCASFDVVTPDARARVDLRLVGRHHVANAMAVVAVAIECGMSLPQVAAALGRARPLSRWRMEVTDRADGVRVVNDAYNANPDSMLAALSALRDMSAHRRAVAVLGTMLELGDEAEPEHRRVGTFAGQLGIDRLVVVGETARPICDGAAEGGVACTWVPDADAAYAILSTQVRPGDVVLFKSSRDAGLRWLGERFAGEREES
jgi:UDP-N-acetylmuramoyl-tripeptide--D-alanyl-D-alanine ligase